MKCKACGAELADDAKFCRSCGAATTSVAAEAPKDEEKPGDMVTAQATAANATTNAADGSKQGAASVLSSAKAASGKNKKLVAGIAAGVAVVLVAVIAFVMVSGNVPEDVVKQDLAKSDFVQEGAVDSEFVNDSPYQITEFKITKQVDEKVDAEAAQFAKAVIGTDTMRRVEITGKIANDNFETSFQGHAYYVKNGSDWGNLGLTADSKDTKPLKGVDTVTSKSSYSGSSNSDAAYSDFASTLEESGGSYTSVATQKVKYSYWFADDTATSTTKFTFDQEKGWQRQGNAEFSDMTTEWKLAGKTFSSTFDTSAGKVTETVSFAEVTDGSASCTYVAKYDPSREDTSYVTYHAANLTGTATGAFQHDFSKETFTIELNDSGNSLTYILGGSGNSSTVSAGQGTVNTVNAQLKTSTVYKSLFGSESLFETSGKTLTEVTNA